MASHGYVALKSIFNSDKKGHQQMFQTSPVCIYKNVRAPAISPRMASTNGHPMCSPHTSHRGLHSLSLIGTPVRSFCNSNPWIITTFLIRGGAWWCPKDTVKKMGPVKSILSLSLSLSIIWYILLHRVGGWPTPLNILFSWDDYSQYMGNIEFMFQTTNQTSILHKPSHFPSFPHGKNTIFNG